jgi:hypothetical protein
LTYIVEVRLETTPSDFTRLEGNISIGTYRLICSDVPKVHKKSTRTKILKAFKTTQVPPDLVRLFKAVWNAHNRAVEQAQVTGAAAGAIGSAPEAPAPHAEPEHRGTATQADRFADGDDYLEHQSMVGWVDALPRQIAPAVDFSDMSGIGPTDETRAKADAFEALLAEIHPGHVLIDEACLGELRATEQGSAARIEQLEGEKRQLEVQIDAVQERARAEHTHFQAELQSAREQAASRAAQVAALTEELATRSAADSAHAIRDQQLRSEIQTIHEALGEAQAYASSLEKRVAELQSVNRDQSGRIAELEARGARLETEKDAVEKRAEIAERRAGDAEGRSMQLEDENRRLNAERGRLVAQTQTLSARHDALEALQQEQRVQLDQTEELLREEREHLRQERERRRQDRAELQQALARVQDLTTQQQTHEAYIDQLEQAVRHHGVRTQAQARAQQAPGHAPDPHAQAHADPQAPQRAGAAAHQVPRYGQPIAAGPRAPGAPAAPGQAHRPGRGYLALVAVALALIAAFPVWSYATNRGSVLGDAWVGGRWIFTTVYVGDFRDLWSACLCASGLVLATTVVVAYVRGHGERVIFGTAALVVAACLLILAYAEPDYIMWMWYAGLATGILMVGAAALLAPALGLRLAGGAPLGVPPGGGAGAASPLLPLPLALLLIYVAGVGLAFHFGLQSSVADDSQVLPYGGIVAAFVVALMGLWLRAPRLAQVGAGGVLLSAVICLVLCVWQILQGLATMPQVALTGFALVTVLAWLVADAVCRRFDPLLAQMFASPFAGLRRGEMYGSDAGATAAWRAPLREYASARERRGSR